MQNKLENYFSLNLKTVFVFVGVVALGFILFVALFKFQMDQHDFKLSDNDFKYKFKAEQTAVQSQNLLLSLKTLVEQNPKASALDQADLAEAYLSQARIRGDANDYKNAETWAQRALKTQPDQQKALLVLVQVMTAQHQFQKALQLIESQNKGLSLVEETVYFKALILLALGRTEEAFVHANRYIQNRPGIHSATLKANVLAQQGQDALAFIYFKRALQIEDVGEESQSALTRAQLAQLLIKKGEYKTAIQVCDEVLRFNPRHALSRLVKSQALNSLQQYQKAYSLLSEAFAESKDSTYLLHMLYSLKLLNKADDFKILSTEVQRIYEDEFQNNDFGHLLDLASIYYLQGDDKKALEMVQRDRESRKTFRGELLYAKLLIRLNKKENARDILENLVLKGVTDVSVFYLLTELLPENTHAQMRNVYQTKISKNNPDFNQKLLWTIP